MVYYTYEASHERIFIIVVLLCTAYYPVGSSTTEILMDCTDMDVCVLFFNQEKGIRYAASQDDMLVVKYRTDYGESNRVLVPFFRIA